MATSSTFYTGVWINQSKGAILGATYTASPRVGVILVAVLALFVSLAGSQSWGILRFLAHQFRSTRDPRPGIYFQQQVILRNTGVASAAIWQLGRIGWAWRLRGVKSFQKTFGLLLLGLSHLLLFTAAGILSSTLARVSNEVLVRSPNCGIWSQIVGNLDIENPTDVPALTQWTNFNAHRRENVDLSREYVADCLNGYQASPQCNAFKQNQLSFTTTRNASCPFSPKMCLGPANGSLYLDTGLLDSRDDFGVNSRRSDRVLYRKTMSCSPITTEGYIMSGNGSWDGRGYNYTAAYYGPNNYMPSSLEEFGNLTNATYVHSDYKQLALGYDANLDNSIYTVIPVVGYPVSPMDEFAPIPELFSPNGSTTLVFAAFEGFYLTPSDDLWLSAHKAKVQEVVSHSSSGDQRTNFTVYAIDKTISVLGCLEQHQLCNPNRPKGSATRCTPQMDLGALYAFNQSTLFDTDHQLMIGSIIGLAIQDAELVQIIPLLASPLLASSNLMTMESTPIAPDQWVLEALNWFSTGVNLMQRGMAEIATGPSGQDANYTANAAANDTILQWYCDNVVVRNGGYVSFSVLAIGLVVGLGGLIIISSLFFEKIVGWMQKKWTRKIDRQTYWSLDSALQLQRMAFEEAGLGTWERCAEEIPVTAKGELIQVATEWDEWHPTIRGMNTVLESSLHPEVVPEKSVVSATVCEIPTPTSISPTSTESSETRTEILEIRDQSEGTDNEVFL